MLFLNDGVWLGERLFPEGFVAFSSAPAPAWRDSTYGGMVWVNARGTSRLPRDAYAFRGAGGQEVAVVPSRDLVIVRMGHFPGARAGGADLNRAHALLLQAIPQKAEGGGRKREDEVGRRMPPRLRPATPSQPSGLQK
jgi:CubicO group peptidase (beta-lactamase class C family)